MMLAGATPCFFRSFRICLSPGYPDLAFAVHGTPDVHLLPFMETNTSDGAGPSRPRYREIIGLTARALSHGIIELAAPGLLATAKRFEPRTIARQEQSCRIQPHNPRVKLRSGLSNTL